MYTRGFRAVGVDVNVNANGDDGERVDCGDELDGVGGVGGV